MRSILISLFSLAATTALAADARSINFATVITNEDGKPYVECTDPPTAESTDPACKAQHDLTLGIIAFRALSRPEQGVAAEDNLLRGNLALRVYKAGELSLSVEEIALIKKRIGVVFAPVVVARCFPLLDPATAK
jgi:hypothetical protein